MRALALIFGVIFVLMGILGFIPGVSPNQHLFGLFYVNTFHNFLHLISGIIFIWVGVKSARQAILFFLIFGAIYFVVALFGFYYKDRPILGVLSNNMADAWLHLILGIIMFYVGYKGKTRGPS